MRIKFISKVKVWIGKNSLKFYPNLKLILKDCFKFKELETCTAYSQLCESTLQTICPQITDVNQFKKDTILLKLCGCYLPSKIYELPGIVPRECQNLCNYPGASHWLANARRQFLLLKIIRSYNVKVPIVFLI